MSGTVALPEPTRFVLNWGPRYVVSVLDVGLACCAVEFVAATMARPDLLRPAAADSGPRHAEILVVSGTVTDKLAPAVLRRYEQLPDPKYVISFGACSNCGGPYWDSYSVTKGVDQLIPVDVYVPGCPPRPEALLAAIMLLRERADERATTSASSLRRGASGGSGASDDGREQPSPRSERRQRGERRRPRAAFAEERAEAAGRATTAASSLRRGASGGSGASDDGREQPSPRSERRQH